MGEDKDNRNQNRYFSFKGDRTRRGNLPVVMFKTAFLTKTKYKSKKLKEVVKHFDTRDVVVVIPVDDTKQVRDIPSSVKLPMKWVAEVMESHPYPNELLEFVMRKTQIFRILIVHLLIISSHGHWRCVMRPTKRMINTYRKWVCSYQTLMLLIMCLMIGQRFASHKRWGVEISRLE